ncbi:Uncharacterized protein LSUB1_G002833 [Lachnellula subtilissima]|uniref:T6SS Phospholipase effector Tle1-like catalytic domain-containing protein n=1 Tax=Lachnellula subtilissima TaxID=602034 RepID=A0A8H8RNM2_9HELO|nr:Uncharacterized protein LSUB1_G002833 [Lachnellula subtilissima]
MSNHPQQDASVWRPKAYPAQEWTGDSLNQSAQPQESEFPERFPTTIQAVQDSRDPYPGGRTLVICLDGTGDKFDGDNSNVVNFVGCLKKDDPSQVTYYQSGIGTYDGQGLKSGFSAAIDMAVGSSLGIHVRDAYAFLMQNYREGDKICLLGFSRGSYTVRCLAGMLHKVGLLPAYNQAQIYYAYQFYKNDTPEGWQMSAEFKRTFSIDVDVYFVGVWDSVASVGFIPRKLPFSKSPTSSICYFRHAMALDEHRAKFKVFQWQHQDPVAAEVPVIDKTPKAKVKAKKVKAENGKTVGQVRRVFSSCFCLKPSPEVNGASDKLTSTSSASSFSELKKFEQQLNNFEEKKGPRAGQENHSVHKHKATDVLEVWFAGAHADVGGGAVVNEERHMLSRIPLRWMIRQCFETNTGILFSTAALAESGIDIPTVWPLYLTPKRPVVGPSPTTVEKYESGALPPIKRRSTAFGVDRDEKKSDMLAEFSRAHGYSEKKRRRLEAELLPEHVEDHFDAMAPINDQLVLAKGWWVLEVWPVKVRIQKKDTEVWEKVVRMNLGRYRAVREIEPQLHWTVQMRMNDKGYRIRNRVDKEAIWQTAI